MVYHQGMTPWWRKAFRHMKYVSQEHFDAAIGELRSEDQSIKNEVRSFRNDTMDKLDGMTVILRRLDEDRPFMYEWIKRIESDVTMVKKHLKLA